MPWKVLGEHEHDLLVAVTVGGSGEAAQIHEREGAVNSHELIVVGIRGAGSFMFALDSAHRLFSERQPRRHLGEATLVA
jgi:hypothetical protein